MKNESYFSKFVLQKRGITEARKHFRKVIFDYLEYFFSEESICKFMSKQNHYFPLKFNKPISNTYVNIFCDVLTSCSSKVYTLQSVLTADFLFLV